MSHDSTRTRIWFPLFSYFESSVEGIIPNEYKTLGELFKTMGGWLINIKDLCMLTARRIWLEKNQNRSESNKRQKRSQSSTPKKASRTSANGNSSDKPRRSMSNSAPSPSDDTDKTVSTKKSVNYGPKKD